MISSIKIFANFSFALTCLLTLYLSQETFLSFFICLALVIICLIAAYQKTLIMTIFSVKVFIGFLLPYMLVRSGWSNIFEDAPRILATKDSTMIYVVLFYSILMLTYLFLDKSSINKTPSKIFSLKYSHVKLNDMILLPLFMFVAVAGDYFLFLNGMLIMVAQEQIYFGPFAAIIKILASFKWLLLLYCGYLYRIGKGGPFVTAFYILIIIPYCMLIGIISGSRFNFFYPILIIIYNHFGFFKRYIPLMVLMIPFVLTIFPILGNYRSMPDPDLYLAYELTLEDLDVLANTFQVAFDRLSQLSLINVVFETMSQSQVHQYRSDYLFNLYGLIPRLIWPNKPSPLDTNEFGVQMGALDEKNYTTSIGFEVVGESFIMLGYFGLIIAAFQAYIFWFIENKIDKGVASGFMLYMSLAITAVMTGTYVNIIPTLILASAILPILYLFNRDQHKE